MARPAFTVPVAVALLLPSILVPPGAAADDGGAPPPAPAPEGAPPAPATTPVAAPDGVLHQTTGEEVRLRAGPSANFRVLERLPRGAWLVVTGIEGEWRRVRVPGGVPAFVHPDLVAARGAGVAEVTKSDVLLRPTAGREYFPVEGARLQPGTTLHVLGTEAGEGVDWLRVLTPDDVDLFVHASLIEPVAAAEDWREEWARRALERRDGYTGGREAEAARLAAQAREDAFSLRVAAAERALAETPVEAIPEGLAGIQAGLKEVMTESGRGETRLRAAAVARELLLRERTVEVARLRKDLAAARTEVDARLGEAEDRYRAALADLLKATPAPEVPPRFLALGTIRRSGDGYVLEKGGVRLYEVDSLRYDLAEFVGRHVGVNGRNVDVDPARRRTLLRVDSLEIME